MPVHHRSSSVPLRDFCALDLETTGLEPERDEIVQVGAVRVRGGREAAAFTSLVRARRPLPLAVQRLTGLTPEEVAAAPGPEEVLSELVRFLSDDPLVGHNLPFDLSFLADAPGWEPDRRPALFDTLPLARILLPTARSHRLSSLCELAGIPLARAHDALEDARGTALLFQDLVERGCALEADLLALLHRLAVGAEAEGAAVARFLDCLIAEAARRHLGGQPAAPVPLPPLADLLRGGTPLGPPAEDGEERGGEEAIGEILGPGGLLARTLPGYEDRPEQVALAKEILRAFEEKLFLVAEAGTGTGKSLAYIVPGLLWSRRAGERVVVSTNTRNLQEQLVEKDLPRLEESWEGGYSYALLKGRSNYLCRRRWEAALARWETTFSPPERVRLLPLIVWARQTRTGDVAECTGFLEREGYEVWMRLCSDPFFCRGGRCSAEAGCYLQRARRAAQRAHLVIVNHSLLLADLATERAVLGEYRSLILDEAHNLEKVAHEFLGHEVSFGRFAALADRLRRGEKGEAGLLPLLRGWREFRRGPARPPGGIEEALQSLARDLQEARREAEAFFEGVVAAVGATDPSETRQRYLPWGMEARRLSERATLLLERLEGLVKGLERIGAGLGAEEAEEGGPERETVLGELEALAEELRAFQADLVFLVSCEDRGHVYWAEFPGPGGPRAARLRSSPVDVAPLLEEQLLRPLESCVLTSATLTVSGNFDFFLDRTGLRLCDPERLRTVTAASPFDFPRQVLLAVPAFLPAPRAPRFAEESAELLLRTILRLRRGTLVLFTSYDHLDRVYSRIKGPLEAEGILCLAQGHDGSRTTLLQVFREERTSVLLGTDSFWEGVDVPGEALEALVIVKLPFHVPTDPVTQAIAEDIEAQGENPFLRYFVPQAVIRLRQGFGRLIRRKDDRGVVAILDARVATTTYGKTFLSSLPVPATLVGTPEDWLRRLEGWWGER